MTSLGELNNKIPLKDYLARAEKMLGKLAREQK
jgi:hypothetical protein